MAEVPTHIAEGSVSELMNSLERDRFARMDDGPRESAEVTRTAPGACHASRGCGTRLVTSRPAAHQSMPSACPREQLINGSGKCLFLNCFGGLSICDERHEGSREPRHFRGPGSAVTDRVWARWGVQFTDNLEPGANLCDEAGG